MTISTTTSRISYNGNGATTAFSFPYRFFENADLVVELVDAAGAVTTHVLNTDYTVTGADLDAGGTVTMITPPASGERLVIRRVVEATQETDYISGDPFPAESHERALDKLTMLVQQNQEALTRTLQLPPESDVDASTINVEVVEVVAGIAADVTAVALIDADVSTVAAIDADVTTVAGIASNVTTVAGISADVSAVAAIDADVTTVAGIATDIEAVSAALGGDPDGASLVSYTPAGTGAVATTVQAKLRESVSVKDFGAVGDGVTDDATSFGSLPIGELSTVPSGAYSLSTDWEPAAGDASLQVAGDASFTGAGNIDFSNLIPFQGGPIFSQRLDVRNYDSSWTGYGNIFHTAAYAKASTPRFEEGGGNVIAVYGGADAAATKSACWGANFVSYANNAESTAIGIELNYGVLQSGGLAYGLVIASAGDFAPRNAIQIQANNTNAKPDRGIVFRNRSYGTVSTALIGVEGDTSIAPASVGIDFAGYSFTSAELSLSSFTVSATQANTVNRLTVRGASTGGLPRLSVAGSDANINMDISTKGTGSVVFTTNTTEAFRIGAGGGADSLQANSGTGAGTLSVRGSSTNADVLLQGKGSGGVRIQDGAGANKIRVNAVGVGFFNATPVAKPTITGSRGGNAALASLLTALSDMGLITDLTSA